LESSLHEYHANTTDGKYDAKRKGFHETPSAFGSNTRTRWMVCGTFFGQSVAEIGTYT